LLSNGFNTHAWKCELEAGVTPLFARHSTEWDIDLLFKKPWTLSKKTEFMLGVGPAWVHTNEYGMASNSVSAELVPDFMFWPPRSIDSAGISNRATITTLAEDTSNRLESASAY
jgi:hypothetical protein